MINNLKILIHQGKQYIPDVTNVEIPGIFRGIPVISNEKVDEIALEEICPLKPFQQIQYNLIWENALFAENALLFFPTK